MSKKPIPHPMDAIPHPFVHYCEHPGCKEWGAYGFGCQLLKGIRGRWFCREHKGDGERKSLVASPPVAPDQGRLL